MNNKFKTIILLPTLLGLFISSMAYADDQANKTNTQPIAQQSTEAKQVSESTSVESSQKNKSTSEKKAITQQASEETISEEPPRVTKDPYQGFNRVMFVFNDKIDIYFLKPIATAYNKILPKPIKQGVHNFFNNINNLPTIANDLLQFNFRQAANDIWRLGINTTIGIGGLFDIADRIKLKQYSNDFGLTLAAWGFEDSNYLVLPFFGPSTIRDGIGIPVDYFEFSIYPHIYPTLSRYEIYGLGIVDRRAQLLQFQEVLEEAEFDKYIFMRNAYLQRRAFQIKENQNLGYQSSKEHYFPCRDH